MTKPPWPEVALGEVATIDRNSVSADAIAPGRVFVGLENITSIGGFNGVAPVESGQIASPKFTFTQDHLLYGKLRPYLAKIAAPTFGGVCSTDILPVRPGLRIDRRYLLHFLRQPSMVAQAASLATGANLPRLSPKSLEAMRIPLPPVEEQRRIAAILDAADELRAKRRQSLALLDSLTESIFLDMFGDPVRNERGWDESYRLGEVADVVSGITKGRRLREQDTRSVPYLAVANVQAGYLRLDSVKSIDATGAEIERYRLRTGDLLLTEGGDPDKLGRGTLWANELSECIHQNHVFRVRVHDGRFIPEYVSWLLGSARGRRYFLRSAKQTTGIASINKAQLTAFPLLRPPHERQQRFVDMLTVCRRGAEELTAQRSRMDELFHSLQYRAFRGEL